MEENLDPNAIHELEEELDIKIYPGTEIMKDVGTHHFMKAHGGGHSVLVPQPSDDPHDPLNWKPFYKATCIFCATALSFCLNLGPLALAPMFGYYIEEWNSTLADVIQFTGVAILVLGFSNFIWVPIMTCFGRRPVAIICIAICLGSAIWRARATSYNSFMGASVLNGLGAGPCETLMPQVIADIIFLHDRGKYQTLYFAMYFISLMVGPIISGSMAQRVGWRNFWWFYTGLLVFVWICNICFFYETRYSREYMKERGTATAGSATANNGVVANNGAVDNSSEEKAAKEPTPATHQEDNQDIGQTRTVTHDSTAAAEEGKLDPRLTHDDPWLGRGKPSKQQFKLFQKYEGNYFRELWLPLYLHIYPIVEFAAFVVSWTASGYLVVNLTQTQAFAAPPYNFTSGTIGNFNIAVLIGGLIGLFTCGPFSDWIAAYLTRRNNGIREPEMRLVAMIPYVIVMIIGSVITAVGYDDSWPWQAVVVIGYSFLGMQVAALPSIASTYAIDSYKPITGSMFVTITINKNVWGYGLSKFITPWAISNGFKAPILLNMALMTFFCLTGIIFWFWGKKFRGLTKDSFVHRL